MIIKSSEKKEKNIVELIVEVSADEFEAAVSEAFRKSKNSIAVPGFRKGKAPRKIIERMYGASIFHSEALEKILPSVVEFAEKQDNFRMVGTPSVKDVDIKEEEGTLEVTLEAAEYPEIKLGEYKGLSAVKPLVEIDESEIDKEIEDIRVRNARHEKADRPVADGDTATIDYEGFVDGKPFEGGKGEDYELVLGSGRFIPGFEDNVIGMAVGDERDINLVFPENYTEQLAGKSVVFKVKLKELREMILPDLDDEFAKDVSEFDTLKEYKESIRERFQKAGQAEADAVFETALLEQIAENIEADVPDAMVEDQVDVALRNFAMQASSQGIDPAKYLQMTGTTPDQLRENYRETSEKHVRVTIALEKIAEIEGIEVSDEDVENDYKEAAERYGVELEKAKEAVDEETIIREIKLRRAAKLVVDNAIALEPEKEEATEPKPTKATPAKKPPVKKPKPESKEAEKAKEATEPEEADSADSAKPAPKTAKKPAPKKTT